MITINHYKLLLLTTINQLLTINHYKSPLFLAKFQFLIAFEAEATTLAVHVLCQRRRPVILPVEVVGVDDQVTVGRRKGFEVALWVQVLPGESELEVRNIDCNRT